MYLPRVRSSLLLALPLGMLCLAGCGDKAPTAEPAAETPAGEKASEAATTEKGTPAEKPAEKPATDPAHGAQAPAIALELDNGEKWKLDDHTRAALAAMDARVKAGPATDDAAGYTALGEGLDGDIQKLVRGCKMTGPSHDQLHVWLTAVIPAIGALRTVEDPAAGKAKRDAVAGLMTAAHRFFE